ncbi:Membrane protein TerC [Raineya orbicola]|jgi:predicted tellurium resistance membrane protein TerC|uniref:Membrane protein TerC n=2 Tax=Raineya orbicola TaxID=2016530 RepID=A0A2N3IE21_9BACT|nr:Membrane protein TerC [Raineya orbicola]
MNEVISHLLTTESLIAIISLTLMEVVLGIDNIIFISVIANKLEKSQRKKTTNIGLIIAILPRVLLLFLLSFIIGLTKPLFHWQLPVIDYDFHPSGRDLILLAGGLFLIYKATAEIHHKLQGHEEVIKADGKGTSPVGVIVQIALLNIVFSFDSILTAIGMVDASKPENLWIMIIAVVLSMMVMIFFANPVNDFVSRNPTVKMLALAFLVMIGTVLIMEGLEKEVSKGYVYFAMFFALFVEMLNMRMVRKAQAVRLRMRYVKDIEDDSAAEARLIDTEMTRKHLQVKHLKGKPKQE